MRFLALSTMLLVLQPCLAQVRVDASIRPGQGHRELETIQFIIQVHGTQRGPAVVLEGLENLRVVAGPSTGTNISSINGRTQVSTSRTWTLLPVATGPARIPSQNFEVEGKSYSTEPITLTIGAAGSGPPVTGGSSSGSNRRGEGTRTEPEIILDSIFAKTTVYVGEAVAHRLDVFSDVPLNDLQFIEEPDFADFWVETNPTSPSIDARRVDRGGKIFLHYPFRLSVLIPNRAGTVVFDPYIAQLEYRDQGDRLRFFSFGSVKRSIRRSETKNLEVKPLPTEGRPEDFDGSIGTFGIHARVDREVASVDDAIGLEVTVEGTGFLKSARPPEIPVTPGLKVFPPKATETSQIVNGRLVSRKTWEWILVPLQGGELRLPQLVFSFFDPDQGVYRTERAVLPVLTVGGGNGSQRTTSGGGSVRELRQDVEFVKSRTGLLRMDTKRLHQQSQFLFWSLTPLCLAGLGIGVGRWRHYWFGDRAKLRARRAGSAARRRLTVASKQLEEQDVGSFYEGLSRALVEYIADRFDVEGAGLTYEKIDQLISERGVEISVREALRKELESCDYARFVPSSGAKDNRQVQWKEARRLIEELERAL